MIFQLHRLACNGRRLRLLRLIFQRLKSDSKGRQTSYCDHPRSDTKRFLSLSSRR